MSTRKKPTLNVALLLETAARLRSLKADEEEKYNQDTFLRVDYDPTTRTYNPDPSPGGCGTECCIAGHALLAAGATVKVKAHDLHSDVFFAFRGHRVDVVAEKAQRLLGLDDDTADVLFAAANEWPARYAERYDRAKQRMREAGANGTTVPARLRPSRVAADLLTAIAKGKVKITSPYASD